MVYTQNMVSLKQKMIPILAPKQIYKAEQQTIKKQKITTTQLMEQAGAACFEWIDKHLKGASVKIHIFCGIGNNGGDGLVIARKLIKHGYFVKTYIVNLSTKRSKDFLVNFEKLKELGEWPEIINNKEQLNNFEIDENAMIIDAIFGIGLNRTPQGIAKDTIQYLNQTNAYILSIDLPSGLFANEPVTDKSTCIKAYQTITFETPKLAFLLPENELFSNKVEVIPIGLEKDFIQQKDVNYYLVEKSDILKKHKKRNNFSHKGTYGHSLLIGGSFGKIGAVTLASKASLKIGSGLVTAYIPKCGYTILQTSIPEVMVEIDQNNQLEFFNFKTKPNSIGIGIGMGKSSKTVIGFEKFLKENAIPLVVDADALNILSENKKLLEYIPENSIFTPHPKELERLIGTWNNDYEKLEKAKKISDKYKIIVIIKGYRTAIIQANKIFFNPTGNPGLATAGSGDVLTGILTGLLAQGYTPINASILGVYLHGKSADLAMESETQETLIASDIISYLAKAIKNSLTK